MPGDERDVSSEAPWFGRFQKLLAARKTTDALRLLNQVIESDLPLLDAELEIAWERRLAWLCRIDLLREVGRLTEALAWACLECDLHPDNVAAVAIRQLTRGQAVLAGGRSDAEPHRGDVPWLYAPDGAELSVKLTEVGLLPVREQ